MYKIIGADGVEYGPVSQDQIRQWIAEGRLNAASRVQADGSADWKQIRDVPEFATLLHSTAPPPPITLPAGTAVFTSGPKTNPLAGWSLGTGIVAVIPCCCGFVIPAVAAITLGTLALGQIKKNPNQKGQGMAIAGIVLGSVSLLGAVVSWIMFFVTGASNPTGSFPGFPFRH